VIVDICKAGTVANVPIKPLVAFGETVVPVEPSVTLVAKKAKEFVWTLAAII
tara:strand:- start:736 stop:891 length:156 start_codon:yes stop_codon:yes gene_type:complete